MRAGETAVTVTVRLSVQFEPVEGRYRWAGRAAPDATLSAQLRSGTRDVTVRIGEREAAARLGEPDPWGGVRLSGVGRAPWSAVAGA
ncbi:DUF4873 domain-containing protein [Couchioplanes caeruleus subsp. caeruleus]|uniref:DUF4873 domain-containing protein n=1 Tax=Couchioplanes caeruleus subsp. caeruleus TaxID=56427 RepID=A0A1K0FEI1_9ACTN|nr:DUF4873 domain-containing protein [Couchioplanes caeruleus subsp. caeruleus]OJF16050.1 DUF4873 domain-containing protein [Couchioplanes caeruleus subsp. caeruleus]